jgi:hypothetical protein
MAKPNKKQKREKKKRERAERRRDRQGPEVVVIPSPPRELKMSEVLGEFIRPYVEADESEQQFEALVQIATIVWNATLLPARERGEALRELESLVPPEGREGMKDLVTDMIRRKETHFADITRGIVDVQVTWTPTGPHLSVMSTLPTA